MIIQPLAGILLWPYPVQMSTFILHQELSFIALITDSLATKSHPSGGAKYPMIAPKLVHVAPCVYAAHAGTWQPALEMLSELRTQLLATDPARAITPLLAPIGTAVYAKYAEIFGSSTFDVRIALVLTGEYRHPDDIAEGRSSTIMLWEAARRFEPFHTKNSLCFGGSKPLSELAATILAQPFVAEMLKQSPLSCVQALIATHAMLAKLSTNVSPDLNAVIIGVDNEHAVIHGSMIELPQIALLMG